MKRPLFLMGFLAFYLLAVQPAVGSSPTHNPGLNKCAALVKESRRNIYQLSNLVNAAVLGHHVLHREGFSFNRNWTGEFSSRPQ